MSYQEFLIQRVADVQLCKTYDRLHPYGQYVRFRSPNFDIENFPFMQELAHSPALTDISPKQVQFSIPTLGLNSYILKTTWHVLESVKRDFTGCPRVELPKIVVLSNGNTEQPALAQFTDEFISNDPGMDVTLITTPVPHKSNALNILHQHALNSSSEILINLDDDIRLPPTSLFRLFRELRDGHPKFVGLRTIPNSNRATDQTEKDILRMVESKRKLMGWPAPIGRINGYLTSTYPFINNFDVYDDVFLSAYFFMNNVPQYVLDHPKITYNAASSLFEYLKRTRRIRSSDERIVEMIPQEWRSDYFHQIIKPTPEQSVGPDTLTWLEISAQLYQYAESHGMFSRSPARLDETDPSSKDGHRADKVDQREGILRHELEKLKIVYGAR